MNHYLLEQSFVDELVEDIRTGLLQEFDRLERVGADTSAWTNHVKSTLAEHCRDHFMNDNFFAFTSNTFGEYLLDFSYGSYPPAFNAKTPVKRGVDYRLFVACESEWGVEKNPARNYSAVLYDFRKLLDVRAQVKVMVFGYDEAALEELRDSFEALLEARNLELAGETWLFLGVPWDSVNRVTAKLTFPPEPTSSVTLRFS